MASEGPAGVRDASGGQRELRHDAGLWQRAEPVCGHVDDHLARAVVRVGEDVGHAHDRRVRDVGALELGERFLEGPRREPLRH